jgi:hypothetical protein
MLTKENADQLYAALTQLADRMPDFSNGDGVHEKQVWLSQLYAVITEVDEPKDAIFVRSTSNFADKGLSSEEMMMLQGTIYRSLGRAQLLANGELTGTLFLVGRDLDNFASFLKVLRAAKDEV